ncbi:MAG: DNA cytosine methyltransferase [Cyanobacteria bacterium]|nr:DNA cytosine methyltransferase [Cyanobacteriota bacterium]
MNIIDLFSGAGGLSLGLRRAGFNVIANVELNRDAMDTYAAHDPSAQHFNEDIRSLSFKHFRSTVDVVVGGPPCQPFSIGGLRRGNTDERDMIPEFIRCLQEIQPAAFLMENVPGLIQKKARPYFEAILVRLATCGYYLSWAIVNAADYGIPQKRKRLIVMGYRDEQLQFPAPSHGPSTDQPHVKALDILGEQPIGAPPNCPVKFAKRPDLRSSPYAGHLYNGGGRPLDPQGPSHTILASSGGHKTHWIDTEKIAPIYHSHLQSGGLPWVGEVPGARRLSVEECAIIQTFPKKLWFAGKRSSQYQQIGNAVPPDLASIIGKALYCQLNKKASKITYLENAISTKAIQLKLSI